MPSTLTEQWLERLGKLIAKHGALPVHGEGVEAAHDGGPYAEWRTQALAALEALLSKDNAYTQAFDKQSGVGWLYESKQGIGILRAVREDIEAGYLLDLEQIVSAEVFSDFLDMAEHLFDNGYKDPAAMLIGAVLEEGLRRIARREGVTVKAKDDLGSLTQRLADAKVFSRLVQKELQPAIAVRNHADHGEFGEYDMARVRRMHEDVSHFLADHGA